MTGGPVRKVVTRSGRGIRSKFPGRKGAGMVACESPLEADAALLFEFNPAVRSYAAQPSWEVYHDAQGNAHRFAPDFRVDFVHGNQLLVEIKSDRDAAYPPTARVLGLKAMAMQAQGKHYRVLTSKEIRKQPRFANLSLLRASSRQTGDVDFIESLDVMDRQAILQVCDLAGPIGGPTQVFRAIANGMLCTDLDRRLDMQSLVWHPDHREAGDGSFPI